MAGPRPECSRAPESGPSAEPCPGSDVAPRPSTADLSRYAVATVTLGSLRPVSHCGTRQPLRSTVLSVVRRRDGRRVPVVRRVNEPGDRFCGVCGEPLAGDPSPVRGSSPGAAASPGQDAGPGAASSSGMERRLVSVLFADLRRLHVHGRGARTWRVVREMLGGYYDLCRDVVRRYGGVVEKFIGERRDGRLGHARCPLRTMPSAPSGRPWISSTARDPCAPRR